MIARFLLWFLVIALCGFGLIMVVSATGTLGAAPGETTTAFLWKQIAAMLAGFIGALVYLHVVGVDRLKRWWMVAGIVAVTAATLVAVLVLGREVNGAKRWIELGPVNLQPAELAKAAVVIGIAWYFTRFPHLVRSTFYGIIAPVLGFGLLAGLVYATKDLGSVVVMFVAMSVILWYAGARVWQYVGLVALALPVVFYQAAWSVGYRRDRILSFIDPFNSEGPTAYHLQKAFIAIGSGQANGLGLGEGNSKLGYVPECHTDFIFAVICEEFGFVGGCALAATYLALIGVGLWIAANTRDLHRRLLAVGCTAVIGFQAFGNLLVATGSVPTKGMTLPFISYGGSSVAICILLVAIIDSVAAADQRDLNALGRTRATWRGASVKTQKAIRWQTPHAE